jgi:hypothetical protein
MLESSVKVVGGVKRGGWVVISLAWLYVSGSHCCQYCSVTS